MVLVLQGARRELVEPGGGHELIPGKSATDVGRDSARSKGVMCLRRERAVHVSRKKHAILRRESINQPLEELMMCSLVEAPVLEVRPLRPLLEE